MSKTERPKRDLSKLRVPCEVYSRIVGYLRPVGDWNQAKQREFEDTREYEVPGAKPA